MLLAGAKRAENGGDVFGGFGGLSAWGAGAVIAAVDRDTDESHAGVVDEQCAFGFFVSAGAVQNNHGGTPDGRGGGCARGVRFYENAGDALAGLGGEAEGDFDEAVLGGGCAGGCCQWDARTIEEFEKRRARISGVDGARGE